MVPSPTPSSGPAGESGAVAAGWPRLVRTLGARVQADELFERICRDVVEEFGFSRALIATVDERHHRLVARAGYDPQLPTRMYMALFRLFRVPLTPESDGRLLVAAWSAVHRQQAYVPDSRIDSFRPDETTQRPYVIRALGTSEYVVTPIVYRDRTVAVLGVDKRDRGRITEADQALLRDVAQLLALRLGPLAEAEAGSSRGKRPGSGPQSLEGPGAFQSLLDGLEEALLVVGHDWRVLHANRAAAALLGLDPWDVAGSALREVLRPADPESFWALVESAAQRGHTLKKRDRILSAAGGEADVRIAVLPLGEEPSTRAIVMVPADGDQDGAGLDGELLRRSLHDLVAPLQSIVGFADLLQIGRAGELNSEQREFVTRIVAGGEELIERVHRLLTGAALEAGGDEPRFDAVSAAEVIDQVLQRLSGKALHAHVRLLRDVADGTLPILANAAQMTAVFQNLLDNAIEATGPGGTVRVRASANGHRMARFSVSQELGTTVAGGEPLTLDEDWSRAGGARRGRSHGLGLAIVRRVVEAHGGEIWAEGDPESDLSVTFTIPLHG
jgi:PAS domain S-box-containing protein